MQKIIQATIVTMSLLSVVSCNTLMPKKLTEKEGLAEAKEIITTKFPDKDFYNIELGSTDALSETFNDINASYQDKNINKKVNQFYLKSMGTITDPKPMFTSPTAKGQTFKENEINWDSTLQKISGILNKVKETYSGEYEGFSLHRINFTKSNDKIITEYDYTMTKKGEGKKRQGRMVTTNYYEVSATVNPDGTITLKEI